MSCPPNTWEEVPLAVRETLKAPFEKRADGTPGLSQAADVLGWRAGDLNANWGGPRPLTNLLVGSALGSLGGYGLGRLAEQVLPAEYFSPKGIRKRTALLGGILGAAPAAWQASDNLRQADGDPASLVEPWPYQKPAYDHNYILKTSADGFFDPAINRDRFNEAVFADPFTAPRLQAATAGLIEAASGVRGDSYVSPWDVARIAVGAGAGLASGWVAGKVLGLMAGLTPQAQKDIQRVGLWAGLLKSTVPTALGLRY